MPEIPFNWQIRDGKRRVTLSRLIKLFGFEVPIVAVNLDMTSRNASNSKMKVCIETSLPCSQLFFFGRPVDQRLFPSRCRRFSYICLTTKCLEALVEYPLCRGLDRLVKQRRQERNDC